MAIGKKLRFEVFKRDSFTCQYCGRKSPDVVLHVDHIEPVSLGGTDDLINLITSCVDCNLGKGPRRLSDDSVVAKQRDQLAELQARQEQIAMMIEWQRSLVDLDEQTVEQVAEFWSELLDNTVQLTVSGRRKLDEMIKKFGISDVMEAMRIAVGTYIRHDKEGKPTLESVETAWSKVGGICYNRSRWRDNPDAELLDKGWWAFRNAYRAKSHNPPDYRLRRWWKDYLEPLITEHGLEAHSVEIAERAIDLCITEYYSGSYRSYWSALDAIPEVHGLRGVLSPHLDEDGGE